VFIISIKTQSHGKQQHFRPHFDGSVDF